MYAVERLGSYITKGVYTVSGPFHPFGGAVDIIVVEQQDGSFKSSPWYVRFGKFQGVLKSKEKLVNISVNGVEAHFHMYLDHKGEAYFLREVDAPEGETVSYSLSSGDETDGQSQNDRRPVKSKSCKFDSSASVSVDKIAGSSGKVLARSKSRRSRILGLVFGRRSTREDGYQEGDGDNDVTRADSLERAELAANLLEVKWSTNLATNQPWKGTAHKDVPITDEKGDEEMGGNSLSGYENLQGFVEENRKELSRFSTPEKVIETSVSSESVSEGKCERMSPLSRKVNFGDSEHDENVQVQYSIELEEGTGEHIDKEQAFHVHDILPRSCISHEEGGTDRVHSLIYCETSERSIVAMNGSGKHLHETMWLGGEGHGEVHLHAEMLHSTAELLLEDIIILQLAEDGALQTQPVEVHEIHSRQISPSSSCIDKCDVVDLEEPPGVAELYTQMVRVDQTLSSVDEVGSPSSTCTTSSSSNSAHQAQDKENKNEGITSKFHSSTESFGTCVPTKVMSMLPSESSEEEQFLFSDIDGISEMQCVESISREHVDKESVSVSPEHIKGVNGLVNERYGPSQSLEKLVGENPLTDLENSEELKITSTPIIISRKHMVCSEEGRRLVQSLPNLCPHCENPNAHNIDQPPLSQSLDSSSKSLSFKLQGKTDSSYVKFDKDLQLAMEHTNIEYIGEPTNVLASPAVGDPSKSSVASEGGWRIWPFRKSRSKKVITSDAIGPALANGITSDAECALESTVEVNADKNLPRLMRENKMARAMTPTSEQLASLNLKEGKNTVTFTFSTAMLGKQQVDASVYLWKWNTRIVISDVDGTITKSDVLGQFMPLVGVDWSQTGVAHLFSAIKENGYQLLFLSARAISQAYHTRQFLFNLKQDGKALPEGPVVISPDGLFPSLYREVIRRAPHEFKISCLKVIRELFPSDYNPFYAGFGNRDTDEFSYLKIGIPIGKIFIINPKGEVAVNRRVDTRSYSSLHALVNGMFPPMTSSEQEDFNSWNFWKLPPPAIYV